MIKPPIFAFEGPYELCIFSSVQRAESYIEPPDVDEYICMDSQGYPLQLLVKGASSAGRLVRGRVVLEEIPDAKCEQELLRCRLLVALGAQQEALTNASLPELIAAAIKHFGLYRDPGWRR